MKKKNQYIILAVLFFLPVIFLLFLIPAKHNYIPLDVINTHVNDIKAIAYDTNDEVLLQDHISILLFLGNQSEDRVVTASNLKELIYDKFKGFKKFQVIAIAPEGSKEQVQSLKKKIDTYGQLKYWHYVFLSQEEIKDLFSSLKTDEPLENLGSNHVFIIDKDLNQRGRIDDRETNEIEKGEPPYGLNSYDCIKVSELKNKMSEDLRILFTEYREKRKGDFDSSQRRNQEINQ